MDGPDDPKPLRAKVFIGVATAVLAIGLIGYAMTRRPPVQTLVDPADGSNQLVYPAEWIKLPTPKDVVEVYPAKARDQKLPVTVSVNLSCVIRADGGLTDCKAIGETLPNYGFGEAAVKLAAHFRLKTKAPDGSALPGLRVGIPMNFDPIFAARPNPA